MGRRKGFKMSEKAKRKMSESHKGFKHSEETKKKLSELKKGDKNPAKRLDVRNKISNTLKGNIPWMKGKKHSQETRNKLSKSHLGKKHTEETKKKMGEAHKGEKCHWWKGGISCLPYSIDWTRTLRISIRERDKYICKICGEKQGDKAHDVHHIDYDKKNCDPNNLITLCHPCHMKTNVRREYWTNYFNTILDVE